MESENFKLIKERKRVIGKTWDQVADLINKENGTNVTGEQLNDFVKRGMVPFGGWLTKAMEFALEIPERHPKTWISFRGGGDEE